MSREQLVEMIRNDIEHGKAGTIEQADEIVRIPVERYLDPERFEREVARAMVCHSLVNFSIKDDELRSAPIHAGEFASFCQLKPGRYRYKVVRPQTLEQDDARRRLRGEIIVGNSS